MRAAEEEKERRSSPLTKVFIARRECVGYRREAAVAGKSRGLESTKDDVRRININATVPSCFSHLLCFSLETVASRSDSHCFFLLTSRRARLREVRALRGCVYVCVYVCACNTTLYLSGIVIS